MARIVITMRHRKLTGVKHLNRGAMIHVHAAVVASTKSATVRPLPTNRIVHAHSRRKHMFSVARHQNNVHAVFAGIVTLCFALAGGLQGCATMRSDFEEPAVTVTSFRAVPSEGAALSFEIGLRVVNPNRDPLELQGVAYTITLEGHKLITGVGKDLPVIDGYSEGTFTLNASASLFQAIQLLGDLMNDPKDRISYDLDTKLDIGTFYPAIRVRNSGEISLQPGQ